MDTLQTGDKILHASGLRCRRAQSGRLDILVRDTESEMHDVQLIPAFPLTRRNRMVVILNSEGEELGLIDDASEFDAESRHVVKEELERAYFMPLLKDIMSAEEELGVLTLEAETDRGPRTIQIRNARRSIRKLAGNRVVIRDVDSNRYEVEDWTQLPPYGRDLLAQYM